MKRNIKLVFDSTPLLWGINQNSSRSGIYFVTYNLAQQFLLNKNIKLYFYTENNELKLKEYLTALFNNKRIKIMAKYRCILFFLL